jgi:hypothetical protein
MRKTNAGLGRILVFVYGLFALAAGARAGVQIASKFSEAPVAYLLSALAAVVYIVATVGLARSTAGSRKVAIVSCSFELVGVLAVGTVSIVDKHEFPDATVWSDYGIGYGFVPLILPILGLLWLRYTGRAAQPAATGSPATSREPGASAGPGGRPAG